MGEKIQITPIILRNQKPTDIQECFIELFEDYLHYRFVFFADEPTINDDPDSGWDENVYNHFDIFVFKKNIAGIEKSFTKDKKWGVYIIINGFENNLMVYSKTQTPSQHLFDRLSTWLFPSGSDT